MSGLPSRIEGDNKEEAGVHEVGKRNIAREERHICIGTRNDRTEAMIVKFKT
jgi:hypothetical protein